MTIDLENLKRLCAGWPGRFFSTVDGDLAYLPRTADGEAAEAWVLADVDGGPDQAVEMLNAVPGLVAEVERLRGLLRDSCDLTDEALGYAPDYFKVKWGLPEAAARIRREGGLTDGE